MSMSMINFNSEILLSQEATNPESLDCFAKSDGNSTSNTNKNNKKSNKNNNIL